MYNVSLSSTWICFKLCFPFHMGWLFEGSTPAVWYGSIISGGVCYQTSRTRLGSVDLNSSYFCHESDSERGRDHPLNITVKLRLTSVTTEGNGKIQIDTTVCLRKGGTIFIVEC